MSLELLFLALLLTTQQIKSSNPSADHSRQEWHAMAGLAWNPTSGGNDGWVALFEYQATEVECKLRCEDHVATTTAGRSCIGITRHAQDSDGVVGTCWGYGSGSPNKQDVSKNSFRLFRSGGSWLHDRTSFMLYENALSYACSCCQETGTRGPSCQSCSMLH